MNGLDEQSYIQNKFLNYTQKWGNDFVLLDSGEIIQPNRECSFGFCLNIYFTSAYFLINGKKTKLFFNQSLKGSSGLKAAS